MVNENKIKGDNYELFIAEKLKNQNNEVYLWKNIPESILYELGFISNWNQFRLEKIKFKKGEEYDYTHNYFIDTGIDIVVKENEFKLIQCKDWKKQLGYSDISTFLAMCFNYNKNAELYYTRKNGLNMLILQHTEHLINKGKLKMIHLPIKIEQQNLPFQLRDYQIESSNLCKDFFVKNNSGTLGLPCGTGKTEIMIEISKNFDLTIILSPLRALAKQTFERFQERLNLLKQQLKLVDSDGERNTLISGVKIISATFKSADIINEILKKVNLEKTLIIIDEFHNLSKNDIPIEDVYEDEFEDESYNDEESNSDEELIKEKTEIYKLLENQNNKILFVSATPRVYELEDENDVDLGEIIYQMPLSEAINKNLICDYKLYFPLIHNLEDEFENYTNITNKITWFLNSICKLGLQKIIVYCESKDNIEEMKKEILLRQEYYALELKMDSITDIDSSKQRKEKLNVFQENDKISVLFSIRILDEGIDIPCCDSVFISYPSKAKIRNIQRIMRTCRKYSTKNYAKILYWTDDEKDLEFLSSLKEFDPELKSKIKVNSNQYEEFETKEIKKKENKLIVQTIGIREYSWHMRLEECKKFINENNKRPSHGSKNNEEKILGAFIKNQINNYNKNQHIMKNENIKIKWEEFIDKYKEKFLSNEKICENNLQKVENFINENNKRPSCMSKNNDEKILGEFIRTQIKNYNKNQYIMKNKKIRIKFKKFIEKYNHYFLSNEKNWENNLQKCIDFINENNKRPNSTSKNNDEKILGSFIRTQITNYNKIQQIMKNENIRNKWDEFTCKYKEYFLSNEEIWENKLQEVENFINKNNKRPSYHSKKNNNEKQLCSFISNQITNYNKNNKIMKNKEIRIKWEEFINKYNDYFFSNENIWENNLQKCINFINENNKRPSHGSKNNDEKILGVFISTQITNYNKNQNIMINEKIKIKFKEFLNQYNDYFLSNEKIWENNLQKCINFINENNKRPSHGSKNNDEKILGKFISHQLQNYKNNKFIMKNEEIRIKWEEFINKYKKYF
jgi:superfamily II DNA or RNA helicase